jgi:anaerobic sulfite reductase subunit B
VIPVPYRVVSRREETADTVTLALAPLGRALSHPQPGQFDMLYAFGVGEVPISLSGLDPGGSGEILHTLRAVGAVTKALHTSPAGAVLGVRGPFGAGWRLPAPVGSDLVIVAGGIGLAPLRPVVRHALENRRRYRDVTLLIGGRTPEDLLFTAEYPAWRAGGVDVRVTVDRADRGWTGHVGVVTTLFEGVVRVPDRTRAYTCGPEVMMRFAARLLAGRGVAPRAIEVSLERNMRCGIGLCGHCQLGPLLTCRDGPVVGYDRAEALLAVGEL